MRFYNYVDHASCSFTPIVAPHLPTNIEYNYNRINEWPLQFLRTGFYYRSYGFLAYRTTSGYWWSDAAGSATNGHYLHTGTSYVYAQNYDWRGDGFALRCASPIT